MNEKEEALKDIKEQLEKIKENNRQQIQLITLMADDYNQYAEDVAKLIVNHIRELPNELKLIGIYVMDSIIKFQGDMLEKYRRLFGNEIVKLFVDTFEKAPIAHRQNLFKVRSTWHGIFLKSKLFEIDNEIQKIDRSWPVFKGIPAAPKPQAATAPVTPTQPAPASISSPALVSAEPSAVIAPFNPAIPPPSTSTEASTSVAPVKNLQPRQQVSRQTPTPVKKFPVIASPAKVSTVNSTITKASTTTKVIAAKVSPSDTVISSSSTTKQVTKASPNTTTSSTSTTSSSKARLRDPRLLRRQQAAEEEQEKKSNVAPRKSPTIIPVDPKPTEVKTKAAPVMPKAIKKEAIEDEPMDISTAVGKDETRKNGKMIHKKDRKHGLNDPRQHGKYPQVQEKKRRREESLQIQPTVALGAHAFLPPSSSSIPMPPKPSVSPLSAMLPPQQIKAEVDDSWRNMKPSMPLFNQPPPAIINSGPPPMASMAPSPAIITNETPKIGSCSNNRIFVDGRAYEVIYINNEAVIERNGLPHRIFFSGPPRDILIDGQPYRLAFDEIRMINIDGVPHPIRFGAPSRELYVGDHPFRGAFNGPPMIANINGRRHEFRLCGSPPEVRIDPDPCYELSRHMNAVRGPQAVKPKAEEKLGTQDVFALLKKIKQHGILNKASLSISKDESKSKNAQKPSPPAARMDVVGTAREVAAPPSLKDFHIGSLMVRYSEVVEALHRPRAACTHCGIGFTDTSSNAYRRHLDMHVQDLLRTKDTGKSRPRPWFMSKDQWMNFDELADVQREPSSSNQKTTMEEGQSSSPSDAIATNSLNKTCPVCFEKFNEYYDDDEEEWKYQNCVVKRNIAYHGHCMEQMDTSMDEVKHEPLLKAVNPV